jgi:hypothetical protein
MVPLRPIAAPLTDKEDKMAEKLTISGHTFKAPTRYEEGHELTANEASALNQTYHENLRNNFAKKVSDALDGRERLDDQELADLQEQFDQYAEGYEFGVRTGGGAVRDPVMAEAMRIARDKIWEHLKRKNVKRKDVETSKITEAAKKLIDKNPEIMELAKQRVEETQAAAASELEDVLADVA